MKIILSPAKKMIVDTDNLAPVKLDEKQIKRRTERYLKTNGWCDSLSS